MHWAWWRYLFYLKFKAGSAFKLFFFSVADLSLQMVYHLSILLLSLANTLLSPKCCHSGLEYLQCGKAQKEKKTFRKNIWKQQRSRTSFDMSSYQLPSILQSK